MRRGDHQKLWNLHGIDILVGISNLVTCNLFWHIGPYAQAFKYIYLSAVTSRSRAGAHPSPDWGRRFVQQRKRREEGCAGCG